MGVLLTIFMFFNSFYFPYYRKTPSREDGVFLFVPKMFRIKAKGLSRIIYRADLFFGSRSDLEEVMKKIFRGVCLYK